MIIDHTETNFALLLARAAEQWPDRVFMTDQGQQTTFRAAQARAARFADRFVACGVRRGDRVCILVPRGVDAAAAFFGALAVGAVGCIVNEGYRPRQIRFILAETGARVIVAGDEQWEPFRSQPPISTHRINPASVANDHALGSSVCDDLQATGHIAAQITFTSGSTGGPKGVLASHVNLWVGATIVPQYLGLNHLDRIASLLPFSSVYGFSQLTCALTTGATLIIERSTLARDMLAALDREQATVVAGVPSTWTQLISGGMQGHPLPALRIATCAGGRLAPAVVRAIRRAQPHVRLFLMYGLTEVFRSTFLDPDEVDAHPDSIGKAVPGADVFVLRSDGTPCRDGEVGELVHRGPTVAMGYWNDPDLSERVFRPEATLGEGAAEEHRAAYSGDLVKRDAEGLLYFVGRRDRMIKTLGFRVSPDEVTDVLLGSRLVEEAAVTSEPDAMRGERIVAHVVMRSGVKLADARRFCGVELPRYMQPTRYEEYESLPRNPSGKIDLLGLRREPESR